MVIFTDLDGTLLAADTYRPGPSIDALKLCKANHIPVVFVSSKTRAEIERLRRDLENEDPFVSENGGGIYLPKEDWDRPDSFSDGGDYWVYSLGKPYKEICRTLVASAETCGVKVEGFSTMSVERVAQLTGLSPGEAELSRIREYDEPFLIGDAHREGETCLKEEITKAGMAMTSGGRFHHIMGGCDKGRAVEMLLLLYKSLHGKIRSVAIGDASNDLPMLRAVENPFLVRKLNGGVATGVETQRIVVTNGIGPDGFHEVIRMFTNAC
jgi:mannosyl-3-phosphoglycerate phosphatase